MFVRVTLVLDTVDDATIVPFAAVTTRDDRQGLFVLNEDGRTVSWRPVTLGIREGERVQVLGAPLKGSVVTLGQQLLGDGSPVTVPGAQTSTSS